MPGEKPVSHTAPAVEGLIALARQIAALKTLPRTGWLDRGVDQARVESVADHSYGVALLAWVCAVERQGQGMTIDPHGVLALALLHDLAEADTGDMTPYDPEAIPNRADPDARRAFLERRHVRDTDRAEAKRVEEDAAIAAFLAVLPATTRAMFGALWDELRRGESTEARYVKQVDRLETFLQSRHYLRVQPGLPMDSFRLEALETIDDPLLAAIRDAVLAEVASDESHVEEHGRPGQAGDAGVTGCRGSPRFGRGV